MTEEPETKEQTVEVSPDNTENLTSDTDVKTSEASNETLTVSEDYEEQKAAENSDDTPNKPDYDGYRQFFKNVAQRDKLGYEEDEEAQIYSINLVKYINPDEPDETKKEICNTTHISIDGNRNVVMQASSPDGKKTIPDQERFNDLAELAFKTAGNTINFGNITTPEYAARLYLACISHNPPVKMNGAPDFTNEEFRNAISPETLSKIEARLPEEQKKSWHQKTQTSMFEPQIPDECKLSDEHNNQNCQRFIGLAKDDYNEGMDARNLALLYQQRSLTNPNMAFVSGIYHINTKFNNLESEMEQQSGPTLVTDVVDLTKTAGGDIDKIQTKSIAPIIQKNQELGNKYQRLMFPIGCRDGVPHNILLVLDADPKNPDKFQPYILDQLGGESSYAKSKKAIAESLEEIARDTGVEMSPIKYNEPLCESRLDCATVTSYLVEQLSDPNKSPEDFLNTTISPDTIDARHVADQQVIKKAIEKYNAALANSAANQETNTASPDDIQKRVQQARARIAELQNQSGDKDDYKKFVNDYNQNNPLAPNSDTKTKQEFVLNRRQAYIASKDSR